MSSIFDIDFEQQTEDLIPPDKRNPHNLAIAKAMMKGLQWARDLVLGSFKTGSIAAKWSAGTYKRYDQVIFKKALYQSLIDSNTDTPDVSSSWVLLLPNFIGADERVKFNGQKIVLEYALNKRFGGVFRPPVSGTHSDIYISNLPPTAIGFLVGETIGSAVGQTTSTDFIGSSSTFVRINNFQINFLNSLYIQTNDKEIRGFADLYVYAGLNYIIVPY